MWKLHFLFIGPKSAKFQALLILQKEIYIFYFTNLFQLFFGAEAGNVDFG